MAGRTRLSRVTRLASRGGRSGRMFRSGARSALHRSPLLRDAARGARARVPDCVLRLRPPARHRFPSRRHERHPRQGLSASEILKLRALRPHAFRTDSRPSASLKLLFSETHKMEMTHYMELMMDSWHMLVLFMAAPMLLAECYVVSEILLLIKPRQGGALAAFNKASAYAAALGIALLSGYAALQFSSVVAWRTWVDAVSALAYVAAGLPFIYVGLLEAGLVARSRTAVWKGRSAVAAVVVYLVLSHAAMVFGMFDPVQFGWRASDDMHLTHGAHVMPETHAGHVMQ